MLGSFYPLFGALGIAVGFFLFGGFVAVILGAVRVPVRSHPRAWRWGMFGFDSASVLCLV